MQQNDELEYSLARLEKVIADLPETSGVDNDFHEARRTLGRYLMSQIDAPDGGAQSLPDAIGAVIESNSQRVQRVAAIILLRVAGKDGILPENNSANSIHRKVVTLVERYAPDLCKRLDFDKNSQTYQKFEAIQGFHHQVCSSLKILEDLAPDLSVILSSRTDILKSISGDRNSAYLQPYGQQRVKSALTKILSDIDSITNCRDHSFGDRISSLQAYLDAESDWVNENFSFFTHIYYRSAISAISAAVATTASAAVSRFQCRLTPIGSGRDIADKHYPLHETGRIVRVSIPLRNEGPGVAANCHAELSSTEDSLDFESKVTLGDITPGIFALTFDVMVVKSTEDSKITIDLRWDIAGSGVAGTAVIPVTLFSQDADIDWKSANHRHPYSTDVAEGEDFVGRTSKVSILCSRFQKDRMGSSFITGQKRVGKTSLARAVEGILSASDSRFAILYLEWGQYSRMDPVETVEALGLEIAQFIGDYLSNEIDIEKLNFKGSLAPLSRLADTLARQSPGRKILIILDEFDEIHPEMYRFGALAEAFFSNLRTLSAKKNIAFLLVGGEKMPFVMSAQGDQLNRFVSEGLDHFVSSTEWDDYVELVKRPSRGVLTWSDSAVHAVFNATNGHPYYTKLLCASIYQRAIMERDADVTASDVRKCEDIVLAELDSNSFAHLWKDGISEDREKAEVIELNRRRFLLATARSLKAGNKLNLDGISQNRQGLKIAQHEMLPIFNDYVRRGILIEQPEGGRFVFSIPLFQRWLVESGSAKLMSDSLAEEYESAEQQAEEEASISSAEIVSLTEKWGPYQGREIGAERVRAWLDQVKSNQEQRLLFKLLKSIKVVSSLQVRNTLKDAHSFIARQIAPFYSERRTDRRKDIAITWVDGQGKSGSEYAAIYAEENKIWSKALLSSEGFERALGKYEEQAQCSVSALVIADDFIGSGRSLSSNIERFFEENGELLTQRRIVLLVVALTATAKGESKVRETLARLSIDADLKVLHPINESALAFSTPSSIWGSAEEMARARELCFRIGQRVYKNAPLGYDGQGALLVFPDTVPNNTLPLIHSSASGHEQWQALFPRPKN